MIYGNKFLNEGVFLHSKDANDFKIKFKKLLKNIKSKTSGFEEGGKLSNRPEIIKFIESNTDKYYTSGFMNVEQQVLMNTPAGNGGMMYISETICVEYFTCIIKNNTIIYFGIQYLPNNKITMHQIISDYDINSYNIPRDIIEYCIDNAPEKIKLKFGKNFVSLSSPDNISKNALKTSFPDKLKQYIESKYNDYTIELSKLPLSRKIKIKKK